MYKVLIIDDEPWARTVVKKLGDFEALGLEIVGEADDGNAGLEMITRLSPDIVITDMRMPGLDGVGLLKTLSETFRDMMIIAMSGYNDFIYLKQAIRSGVIEYLLKPVDPLELNKALKRSIDRLNEVRGNVMNGYGTLHLLEDQRQLEVYMQHRQKIYESLLVHDQQGIERGFLILSSDIVSQQGGLNLEAASKIAHDFILMLEEFIVNNAMDVKEVLGNDTCRQILSKEKMQPECMFDDLKVLYVEAIAHLAATKKVKGQLDITQITSYVEKQYRENISLESIAATFYVSKEHLSRSFKQHMGMTINDYVVKLRMEKAKELLANQQLGIKDVGAMVSYNDVAYFYRVFKKYTGIAPGEFRKKYQDINNVQ